MVATPEGVTREVSRRGPRIAIAIAIGFVALPAAAGISAAAGAVGNAGTQTYSAPAPAPRSDGPTGNAAADAKTVDVVDFSFTPGDLTIHAGDTVTWVNGGPSDHNASAVDDGARNAFFETDIIAEGEQDSITFPNTGTFDYFCAVHPPDADPEYANFTGTITVVNRESGGGTGGGGNGGGGGGNGGVGGGGGGTSPDPSVTPFATSATTPTSPGSLPSTGLDLLPPLIAGATLLAFGLLLRAAYLELVWRGR